MHPISKADPINDNTSHGLIPSALTQTGSVFDLWFSALSICEKASTQKAMVCPAACPVIDAPVQYAAVVMAATNTPWMTTLCTRSFSNNVPDLTG